MSKQRLPARGPRGEAVVIIRTGQPPHAEERGAVDLMGEAYWLGTGERLKRTDDPRQFEASDGRQFTLV